MSEKKVALVTGVSSGIGLSAALGLVKAGYRVFGTVRSSKGEVPEGIERVVLDVRAAALGVGIVAVLLRAPFLVVVAAAAATAALLRLL